MAVEPGDGFADAAENNLMRDEHIKLVPIEAMVAPTPKVG